MALHSAEPYWRKCLSQTWFPLVSGVSTIITGLYAVKTADPFLTTFGVVSGIATVGGAMYSPPAIQILHSVGGCLKSLTASIASAIVAIFSAIVICISAMTNLISAVLKNAPRMGAIILTAWITTMTSWDIEQGRPSPNNPIIILPPTATSGASRPATNSSPRYEAYQAITTATDYDDIESDLTRNINSQPTRESESPENSSTTDLDHTNYWEADSTQTIQRQFEGYDARMTLNNYCQRLGTMAEYVTGVDGTQSSQKWTTIAYLNGVEYGRGAGHTKKAAEDAAARQALDLLTRTG